MSQSFGLPQVPGSDVTIIAGNDSLGTNTTGRQVWAKPPNRSMCCIFLLGAGGRGGVGGVGASGGGGGGGGSGGQTILTIPLILLPQFLYIQVPFGGVANGLDSRIAVDAAFGNILAFAKGGGAGGNGTSAPAAGAAGAGGAVATNAQMPIGFAFAQVLGGIGGSGGSNGGLGGDAAFPTTGLRVTGGAGGAGLAVAGQPGQKGGGISGLTAPFPPQVGGAIPANSTSPPSNGNAGWRVSECGLFFYGGSAGASTHGSATGGGLVQSSGGDGSFGCGGGGGGGALTGSTAGRQSQGGAGLCIITCW